MNVRLRGLALLGVVASGCQVVDQTPPAGSSGTFEPSGDIPSPAGDDGGSSSASDGSSPVVDAAPLGVGTPVSVGAGWQFSCALTSAGAVACWGSNAHGQLGDGSGKDSAVPVLVAGLSSGAVALSVGYAHACAVVGSDGGAGGGSVVCWGANESGELGDGTSTDRGAPVSVPGLGTVTAVAAGGAHSCAVVGGAVSCWGSNAEGQLAASGASSSPTPLTVPGVGTATASVVAITAGGAHTCATRTDGSVWCWGADTDGQLGDGTVAPSAGPQAVSQLTSTGGVCAGNAHTCALVSGAVRCWGYGQFGQLGDGQVADSPSPVATSAIAGATGIASGGDHSCAIDDRGGVWCWGNDQSGQLGDGNATDSPAPVAVQGLPSTALAVGLGTAHSCAVVGGGRVVCWGWNVAGQLGNGTTSDSPSPVLVAGF